MKEEEKKEKHGEDEEEEEEEDEGPDGLPKFTLKNKATGTYLASDLTMVKHT